MVVHPGMAQNVEDGRAAALGVGDSPHDAVGPREHNRSRAHGAGLLRDIERRARETPVAFRVEGGGKGEHFGVRRRVGKPLRLVVRPSEYAPLGVHYDASRRHLAVVCGLLRFAKRHLHVLYVVICVHCRILYHYLGLLHGSLAFEGPSAARTDSDS